MDNRELAGLILTVAVISYGLGYRKGISAMVERFSAQTAPELANYLAARDMIQEIMKQDPPQPPTSE